MNNKIEIFNINNEKVYLRKGFDGYRIVYPVKDENGQWIKKNLIYGGNISNLIKAIAFFIFLAFFFYVYSHDTKVCRDTMHNLSSVCYSYNNPALNPQSQKDDIYKDNFSDIGKMLINKGVINESSEP